MMKFVNFDDHIQEIKLNIYSGSNRKKTVVLDDGKLYMLKFPDPIRELHRDVSYINNAFSEYLGCQIFEQIGFDTQHTILGTFTDEKGQVKIACACEDVRQLGDILHEADKIELELLSEEKELTFDRVKLLLSLVNGIDINAFFDEYCRRFVVDALIGNTDRHNGNWGIIERSGKYSFAPVFDCGSSFSPLYSDEEIKELVLSNEALNVRSTIIDENGTQISYREFLLSSQMEEINQALKEVVPKINISQICSTIDEIPYISDTRKDFYKQLIDIRYSRMLIPALEKVLNIEKSLEYKQWNSAIINYLYKHCIEPFSELPDSGTIEIKLPNTQVSIDYVKNNGIIFFMNNGCCDGMANQEKSNLNICKFVQSLRNKGIDVDIQAIKKAIHKQKDGYDR